MTFDERRELAARRIAYQSERERYGDHGYPEFQEWDFDALSEHQKSTARILAHHALKGAFPDLYGEKPTAWIAPWEATFEMLEAANGPDLYGDFNATGDWEAMRDAHLKRS